MLFRSPQQQADQNITVPNNNTFKSDGSIAAIPPAATGDASPLANFKDLWETPKDAQGNPIVQTKASLVPTINPDPAKIQESASKIDFTKLIPADVQAKALAGDSTAFMQAINAASQATLAHTTQLTAQIVKEALTQQATAFEARAADILRTERVSNTIQADNPLFTNPATAPMLRMVEQQFMAKNPTASPAEISQMAKAYVAGFAEEAVKASGKVITEAPKAPANTPVTEDWEKFSGYDFSKF